MRHHRNLQLPAVLLLVMASLAPTLAVAQATIEYAFTSESTTAGRPPIPGKAHVTSTIDGPRFRNVSRLAGAVEVSDDDGRTTHFGNLQSEARTPLVPEIADVLAPIVGSVQDEQLVIGASTSGPSMFGMPTRVYTVDYTYAIAARVAYVFTRKTVNHARLTFTVADIGISSAALRVAFSRGYGYALCLHPEAFTGLPLVIDGTIESPYDVARVHVEAVSLQR